MRLAVHLIAAPTAHETDGQVIWRTVWTYCTSLFGDENARGPFARYVGSGTFVRFRGAPCLLTAQHVWAALAKYRGVGFAQDVDVNLLKVPTEILDVLYLSEPTSVAWGVDVALLRIPEVTAKRLELRKAFYNLARNREDALSVDGDRLWLFVGATGEGSDFTSPDEALLKNRQFTSRRPMKTVHDDGMVYTDIPWSAANPDAPTTWGGVSGAGLWMVDPTICVPVLAGLAFCERKPTATELGFVRRHSRGDIERMLDTVPE